MCEVAKGSFAKFSGNPRLYKKVLVDRTQSTVRCVMMEQGSEVDRLTSGNYFVGETSHLEDILD